MSDKKTVLIVDDQQSFRDAVAFEFELLGYKQVTAENGLDAFTKFKENNIDLIICDIRMPEWDGRKFLNELRKSSKIKPPFIFMTGFADLQPSEAFNEGADAFVGKPIKPETLVEVVSRVTSDPNDQYKNVPKNENSTPLNIDIKNEKNLIVGRTGFFISAEAISNIERTTILINLLISILRPHY